MLHKFPFVHDVNRANSIKDREVNFSAKLLLDFLRGMVILILVLHNSVKGVACETRSNPR